MCTEGFGCGGCDDVIAASGCLRPLCSSDSDCDAGEVCRTLSTFHDFRCADIAGTCACGGDPLEGTIDVCVPDTCP